MQQQIDESDALLADLRSQSEKLETDKDRMIRAAKDEANQIVEKTREEAEFLMQEIREMQLNLDRSSKVKEHELIDLRKQFSDLKQENPLTDNKVLQREKKKKELKPGDEVLTETYGQRGILLEKDKGSWVVQIGIMKMKLPESDLKKIEEEPAKQARSHRRQMASVRSASDSHVSTNLDLRGYRYEDAMRELDGYLDSALLANHSQITIVHGKGTGAIRQGVTEALKRHPQVKSFNFAPPNAGGDGATIATFK